ncbi:MAG TPA: hypothetical protein VHL80_10825 [Polyangia bacterium]|nr:hypothetical protein [Polyangia bacterium]
MRSLVGSTRGAGAHERGLRAGAPLAVSLTVVAALAGCGGGHTAPKHGDADAASILDARLDGGGETPLDAPPDQASPDVAACKGGDAGPKKTPGQTCECPSDCASGFCVDGVCCSTACTAACKTCAAPGSPGTCTFLVAGATPRDQTTCVAAAASTCGFDGTCDGAGGCRHHVAGTICKPGTCDGTAVVGALACDGNGRCKPGPTTICAPYSCDPAKGACFEACTLTSDCATGQQCVAGSCGEKMKGANCTKGSECASGFCADGVCCNVACGGGCVSCALPDRKGTCWPIDRGVADPRGQCVDQGAASCGSTGTCDGFGSCEKYAAETVCLAASCTGTRRNTPGTCDGKGACRPQGVQNCSPFLCTAGACTQSCATDADCESGHACVGGTCGKKNLGVTCAADSECLSGTCVEGVCCDDACAGACKSCALASTMGHCTPLAAGAVDSKGVCSDLGATTCGTNGRCDGSGGCQKYKVGTVCAPESCEGNVYTPPSTCGATGQCAPPDSLPCAPYTCNGNTCFNACATDNNCVAPNVCNGNSCGKKMRGASCSNPNECGSGFCAQGVCCDAACAGACTSCALTGTLGTCTNVPNDAPDPADLCVDQGPASCGTNGRCQAGACQKYASGTSCAASTCPASTTTFTPDSTCDGSGACVTPAASSCFPYQCGAAVCKASCTNDVDCAAPAVCTNGSCGLKGLGKSCADGDECQSTFCAQGVCCDTACDGTCTSCVLSGSLGHCGNVADGNADARGRCLDQGAMSCGTDGACDGNGACRLYAAGTACAPASCPASSSTLTQVRACDGKGACKPATTLSCAPYLCNGLSACKAACTVDADCLAPDICDPQTNLCGNKRRLGQTCALTADCLTGNFCVDGVCCASSSCALCQTCATGSCANVGAGVPEPHAGCPASPPCGNTGNCNGAGACEQAGSSVACGAASCSVSTFTPVSHCTGAGACATPTTSSCSPYVCGSNACKVTCANDADCVAPFTCQGSGATKSCALKANGLVCTAGNQCISGNCVDGACCGSPSCPACQACNVSGTGACAPVAAGTAAPSSFCTDQGASTCGTNGKCDGAGGCQKYANGTSCSSPVCVTGALALTLGGTCSGGACSAGTQPCNGFKCTGGATCPTACAGQGDCDATAYYCTAVGGVCALKGGPGATCTAGLQCLSGNCVDGVCCGSPSCGSCQACDVAPHAGTCWPLGAGAPDPKGVCADNLAASCGTNGKCDGAGGCQKYADGTKCSSQVCTSGALSLTLDGACAGGTCSAATQSCNGYKCTGGTACPTTCAGDGDCDPSGYYCSGGACTAKAAQGGACTADKQCLGTNKCVDGVCCGSASCGSCQACNVAMHLGVCFALPAGATDPKGACIDHLAASCGTNGKCDGAGGCQKYADGTQCAPASCPSPSFTLVKPGLCASGACDTSATSSCAPYMCNGTTGCRTTCSGDGDCASGNFCDLLPVGSCQGAQVNGATCNRAAQCQSGNCVDGFCCSASSCGGCQVCNATGSCVDNNGIACTTTDKCHVAAGVCAGGSCSSAAISCDDGNPCTLDSCNGATGCVHVNVANGTGCDDGNACTQTDTCVAGVCTGGNPVACAPLDQCHAAGTCNPATGTCTNPTKSDGAPCSDGNACTQTDTCVAGVCTGGVPLTCAALDQCHVAGVCDPGTGACSNPAKTDGALCNDGDACTQTDTCVAGACVGGDSVICTASDQCHVAGSCDSATGFCSDPPRADGTGCDDGDACSQVDVCLSGTCTGTTPVVCSASDQCHTAGTCDPTSGACSNPTKANGTGCNDGNACTQTDTCVGGLCTGGNPVVCPASDCNVGACDPTSGACSSSPLPDGTACDDNDACTAPDACLAGVCVPGPPTVVCVLPMVCDPGMGICM